MITTGHFQFNDVKKVFLASLNDSVAMELDDEDMRDSSDLSKDINAEVRICFLYVLCVNNQVACMCSIMLNKMGEHVIYNWSCIW